MVQQQQHEIIWKVQPVIIASSNLSKANKKVLSHIYYQHKTFCVPSFPTIREDYQDTKQGKGRVQLELKDPDISAKSQDR